MMNVSTASTNASSVETAHEESTSLQSNPSGLKDLSIVKARGRTPSDQDVSHFQQALTRAQDGRTVPLSSPENSIDATVLNNHELSSGPQVDLNGNNVEVKTPAGANPQVTDHGDVTAQLSARLRWLERRRLLEDDKDVLDAESTADGAVIAPLLVVNRPTQIIQPENAKASVASAHEVSRSANGLQGQTPATDFGDSISADNAQASVASAHEVSRSANGLQRQRPATEPHDPIGADNAQASIASNPVASSLPKAEPVNDVSYTTVDMAWASRTVQDTVRATLRTLAQRDLESLDAGRPIQITLDQGQLRGARLTLEANDGFLEVSVATSQAQLRATLEAQQDALAQGLLRDVGAVRWVGLQDVMSTGASNNDTNAGSYNSQQSSQGNGSDRQNQSQNPAAELDDVALSETKSDKGQVIADAQSLRAFLGL